MMILFWDKYDILLTEYLSRGTMISDLYYASIIKWLCCVILEKRRGKVSDGVLLVHANASVHKWNIVQTAIGKGGFVELNHPAYSPDIAPCNNYLCSNSKKFHRGKKLSRDDETIDTVEDYLNKLD